MNRAEYIPILKARLAANPISIRHGHWRGGKASRTWDSWRGMKQRCSYAKDKDFQHYGGRGIKVCKRWQSFKNFLADMGERPEGKTLDRINNDGNYEPGNCRWATLSEQRRNRRRK